MIKYYLSLKINEFMTYATKWINSEDIIPSKKSQHKKKVLSGYSYMKYLECSDLQGQKAEQRYVYWGCGSIGCYCLTSADFQFGKMEIVLEIDGSALCSSMWMYLMTLNCILKRVKMVYFMCIFYNKRNSTYM